MSEQIIFGTGEIFTCPADPAVTFAPVGAREWRRITVTATVDAAKAAFVAGASFTRQWEQTVYNTEGQVTGTETLTETMDAYCVAGDIVDHRDGTVTVFMGKKTEAEIYQETIDALVLAALEG